MKKLVILFFSIYALNLNAQTYLPSISLESTSVISGGKHAPFWFYSNQYGKISTKNNSIYLLPSFYKNLKDSNNVSYSYKLEPLLSYDGLGRSYMHQWYIELKFYFIHFTAGAKEEFYGNQDSTLSTGCIIWSKNARPMPKLKLEVPNYTPVPFTGKYLEFKGGMAHGWFDDNEYNKNVWLHHKYFYLRLGGKLPVHISYGLHHFAQWGGTNYDPYGKLPNDLEAFKNVFFGRGGNSVDPNTPWVEWANKLGNHIGSRNFGAEIDFRKSKVSLYWQNIFRGRLW
ncbi:MAG: capsule assembly Wzi family protein [Bacteroidales bacterium]|nr:capsule assembly Wzi family protein [Bacteroidales bacterium]